MYVLCLKDLLTIYGSLLDKPLQAKKLVERMARLQRLGVPETKAVLDICSLKVEEFKVVLKVVKKFECYETKDIVDKTRSTVHASDVKMSRGEVLTMPSKLLVKLSKMNPEYFLNIAESVMTGKISLKQAVEDYDKDQARTEVKNIIRVVSKKDVASLEEEHQGCFSKEVIDSFLGATADNEKGIQLKKYVEQVMSGKNNKKTVIKLGTVIDVKKITGESDTFVANLAEPKYSEDQKTDFFDEVCREDKSTILLFPSEGEQLNALSYLRSKNELKVKQLLFNKNTNVTEGCFCENLHFGLICGKLEHVQEKINVYNGELENLKSVVSQVTAPGGTVSSVADAEMDLLLVHSKSLIGNISYFGTETQLKVVEEMTSQEGFATEKISYVENNQEDTVTPTVAKEKEITEDENKEGNDPFSSRHIEEVDPKELCVQYASKKAKKVTFKVPVPDDDAGGLPSLGTEESGHLLPAVVCQDPSIGKESHQKNFFWTFSKI